MIYRLIAQEQGKKASTARLCRLFGASRSGFYAFQCRDPGLVRDCPVVASLKASFLASGRAYGSRRLQATLNAQGVLVGRHRVRRLMKEHRLRPVWRRKFAHTTDSKHDLPVAANVLERQFDPVAANRVWVADITYIRTRSGWLYLAAVMDLYSRKIVGWAMAPNMPAELVCSALQMAIAQRQPAAGLVVHSDRGSQYASAAHRAVLERHGLVMSMSRKGNCWDNAVMERFFLNLKMERVWQRDYANHAEAMTDIADYIVGFYNNVRLHSSLGYQPPTAYEQEQATQPIAVSEII
ncbi:IS3 family transposase ISPosp5 [compost metagenome]